MASPRPVPPKALAGFGAGLGKGLEDEGLLLGQALLGLLVDRNVDAGADYLVQRPIEALHGLVLHQQLPRRAVARAGFFLRHFLARARGHGKGGGALRGHGRRALAALAGFRAGFAQHPGAHS